MRYAYKNEDFLYSVDFKVNGNFVMPDDNIYTYKIRNQKGEVLLNETVNIPETSPIDNKTEEVIPVDRAELTIPAKFNTLSDGSMFNTIIVEINFKFEGKPYTLKDSYRVIDFFYFSLIDFPIFNVADIYVTVAAFAMILLGMFYYKDEDYDLIFPSKKEKGKK